jgi:GNAT superfamily N-acetyltransferase
VDLEDFLDLPLVARLAVSGARGRPTVRPVWFLYEEGSFWWLTASSYSELGRLLTVDARASLVIDTCDLSTGAVLAVTVTGTAVVRPFDAERATRKLRKYLGPDGTTWPTQFTGVFIDPTSRLVELHPDHPVRLRDLSFTPGTAAWMLEGTRPKVLGLGVRRSGGPSHVGHGLPVTVVCGAGPIVVRRATSADLEAIVALLGDDPLGSMREAGAHSDLDPYRDAMSTIEADPAQLLLAVARQDRVVGTMQLSILPGLARRGGLRAQIEAVRVGSEVRGLGVGTAMFEWAIEHSRTCGCGIVQLTTDRSRTGAHRFYERLGFVDSHRGFKLTL